jgi:hypothetical protein
VNEDIQTSPTVSKMHLSLLKVEIQKAATRDELIAAIERHRRFIIFIDMHASTSAIADRLERLAAEGTK